LPTKQTTPQSLWLWLLLCALCSAIGSVQAENVPKLYDVEMAVDSQQNSVLKKVAKIALETVFIRVSGSRSVAENRKIAIAIAGAQKYIKQYQYRRRPNQSGEEQLQVVIEFEQTLVDRALREAGLALWAQNRPTLLLWLTVEDINGRRFASEDSDPEIAAAIGYFASLRGLAIKLPLFDLQDALAVEPDEAWTLNSWRLLGAVKRYQSDAVLLGRFSQLSNGELIGEWLYRAGTEEKNYRAQSGNLRAYIGDGLNAVADLMATQYAVAPVDIADNGVLLRLTGVDNYLEYAAVVSYLESVASIRHANIVDLEGDEIIVRLSADGHLSQLRQIFSLDNKLVAKQESDYDGRYNIALDYQWPY